MVERNLKKEGKFDLLQRNNKRRRSREKEGEIRVFERGRKKKGGRSGLLRDSPALQGRQGGSGDHWRPFRAPQHHVLPSARGLLSPFSFFFFWRERAGLFIILIVAQQGKEQPDPSYQKNKIINHEAHVVMILKVNCIFFSSYF